MSPILVAIGLVIACSSSILAQVDAGGRAEDLVRQCEGKASVSRDASERLIENALGLGFFAGMLSAGALAESVLGSPLFCLPRDGISIDQSKRIFLKFAEDHPEHLHETAFSRVSQRNLARNAGKRFHYYY